MNEEILEGVLKQLEGLRQALSFQQGMLGTYEKESRGAMDPRHAEIINVIRIPQVKQDISRLQGEIRMLLAGLPRIRQQETEVARVLAVAGGLEAVPESIAVEAAKEIESAVMGAQAATTGNRPEEMTRLLEEILGKLNEPGRPAAAKLKVAIPLIPAIMSYELEVDSEAFVTKAWCRVKAMFRSK